MEEAPRSNDATIVAVAMELTLATTLMSHLTLIDSLIASGALGNERAAASLRLVAEAVLPNPGSSSVMSEAFHRHAAALLAAAEKIEHRLPK